MSGNKKKQPVAYIEPPEPAFIRRMKEQLGYKEGPNVDTKREQLESTTAEDNADRDDEQPTVVVLKDGDLTEEEAKRLDSDILSSDKDEPTDGKITFKKPVKRSAEKDEAAEKIKSKLEKKESSMAKVKNRSLLSFDDEEDDDEDDD